MRAGRLQEMPDAIADSGKVSRGKLENRKVALGNSKPSAAGFLPLLPASAGRTCPGRRGGRGRARGRGRRPATPRHRRPSRTRQIVIKHSHHSTKQMSKRQLSKQRVSAASRILSFKFYAQYPCLRLYKQAWNRQTMRRDSGP